MVLIFIRFLIILLSGLKLTPINLTDVGAGGLSNALPELLHDTDLSSIFELRDIDNADRGMRYMPLSQIFLC